MLSTLLYGHDLTFMHYNNMGIGNMKICEIASIVNMTQLIVHLRYKVLYIYSKTVIQVQVCPNVLQGSSTRPYVCCVIRVGEGSHNPL